MYSKETMVRRESGLHARAATNFIQLANQFKSSIYLEKEGRSINAKSLLNLLSLNIAGGTNVKVTADGSDEKAAVDALVDLLNTNT